VNEKEQAKQKRIYELSCVGKPPKEMPFQPSFRHLTNILLIMQMDMERVVDYYFDELKTEEDKERLMLRAWCARNWLEKYAPEDFRFDVNEERPSSIDVDESMKAVFRAVSKALDDSSVDDKTLHNMFYDVSRENGVEPKNFFKTAYNILISKDKGPQLANFILTLGKEKVQKLFQF
jgi:lysyl-tRNA synthetase class 1